MRFVRATFVLVGALALANGCDGGREGERCNPNLSHNDCNDGLSCVQPNTCLESFCCPPNLSASTSPFCNGSACPALDAAAVADAGPGDSAPE